jgi:hypothetical protein
MVNKRANFLALCVWNELPVYYSMQCSKETIECEVVLHGRILQFLEGQTCVFGAWLVSFPEMIRKR